MEIVSFALFLASVIVISLSGVMSPGPLFAVTIAKGQKEKNAGIGVTLGHAIVELPIMFLIFLGFSRFFTDSEAKFFISTIGGAMLVYIGAGMIKERDSLAGAGRVLPYSSVAAGAIATGMNPYFLIWWATVGAALVLNATAFGFAGFLIFACVHLSCDLAWNVLLSRASFASRELWSKRAHELIFAACGALLILFGAWFIAGAVR